MRRSAVAVPASSQIPFSGKARLSLNYFNAA
jgi:hypothetical protein